MTQCHTLGAPLFWEQSCVAYSVHERGSAKLGLDYAGTEALVGSAFAAWPTADCAPGFPGISIINFGPTSCGRAEFNSQGPNANAVIFHDLDWPYDSTQIGLTSVAFDTDTGKILGADIEINTFGYSITPDHAKFIVTHEAGHFLGLDHSTDQSAVMFARYSLLGGEPGLTPDDVAAICAAYPSTRPQPPCDAEPARGYAADCGGNVEGSCAMVSQRASSGAAVAIAFTAAGLALTWLARKRRGWNAA